VSPPRLIRGNENLPPGRGRACPELNMIRNTLPPLMHQFVAPLLQLCGDGLNAGGLFDGSGFDTSSVVTGLVRLRQFDSRIGSLVVEMLAKHYQHLDGGA